MNVVLRPGIKPRTAIRDIKKRKLLFDFKKDDGLICALMINDFISRFDEKSGAGLIQQNKKERLNRVGEWRWIKTV